MKQFTVVALALVSLGFSPAFAQQPTNPETFVGVVALQCYNLTLRPTQSSIMESAFSARPINREAACACATSKLRATPRLAPFPDASPEEVRTRLRRPEQMATLMSFAMSAIIGCVATQMEQSLEVAQLE